MSQTFSLDGGGCLDVREDGAMVRLGVCRAPDRAGIYKVRLRGDGGEYLLGTLIPEGNCLRLQRTLSRDALHRAGCWPIRGGSCSLHFPFSEQQQVKGEFTPWRWEHHPGKLLSDPVLQDSAAAWGSMLTRTGKDGFQLAAPFDPRRPFPLLPLLCFASVERVDGQVHAVFSFDHQGHPVQKNPQVS